MELLSYLLPLFFLTALVYATAGFAGGSTYLALLALFALPYEAMPKVALLCNLVVAGGGFWVFLRAGYFSPKKVLPFVLTSIPMAYLGGRIPLGKTLFLWLLALSLLAAGLRMLLSERSFAVRREPSWGRAWALGLPIGAVLGLLSGLVGIGGGIFLSPVLYFLGWSHSREAAAAAAFFILVNSVSGLFGQLAKSGPGLDWGLALPLMATVLLGGQIGSRIGAGKISKLTLQRVTAALILSVSGRLLWGLF
ncbi:MAG: sulfite exporter TauE/SafE family protein [Deltaproteobacteria bacterium]|nr:sulfite exporter TauE/SafE family protein [Deltaproteobacteria bacterium]